jgi:hypothetical protein
MNIFKKINDFRRSASPKSREKAFTFLIILYQIQCFLKFTLFLVVVTQFFIFIYNWVSK